MERKKNERENKNGKLHFIAENKPVNGLKHVLSLVQGHSYAEVFPLDELLQRNEIRIKTGYHYSIKQDNKNPF